MGVAQHLAVDQVPAGGRLPGWQVFQSVPVWYAKAIVQRCVAQLPGWDRIRQFSLIIIFTDQAAYKE